MTFANLSDLWWLIIIVIAATALWLRHQRQKKAIITRIIGAARWQKAFGPPFQARMTHKSIALCAALGLIALAILRPQWGEKLVERPRQGVDIMFVVDVSLSMNADDLKPSRLQRATREIKDLIRQLKGDRVGLVSFAGGAFMQCPLTLDYGSFRLFLDELSPGMIPFPGTDIASALELAVSAFRKDTNKSRVIVLITDGEDHTGKGLKAAALLAEQNVKLYVVSFGTEQGAPMVDPSTGRFIKQGDKLVISKPDFAGLEKLAAGVGGTAFRSTGESYGVTAAYQAIKAQVADKKLSGGKNRIYNEGYQLLLLAALSLLLFEGIMAYRRKLPLIGTLLLALVAPVPGDEAVGQRPAAVPSASTPHPQGPKVLEPEPSFGQRLRRLLWQAPSKAVQAYREGSYSKAFREFLAGYTGSGTRNSSERSGFNSAAAAFRSGQYEVAEGLLAKFVATTPWNAVDKALLYYNLGNAKVETGKLDGALAAYNEALALKPHFPEAAANRDYVKKLKEHLDRQKKNTPEDGKQKSKKDPGENTKPGEKPKPDEQKSDSPLDKDRKGDKAGKKEKKEGSDKKKRDSSTTKDGQKGEKGDKKKGGQDKDKQKKGGGGSGPSRANAWQSQKALDERNAQRLLESIKEDRREYLRRKMPKPPPSSQGVKRW